MATTGVLVTGFGGPDSLEAVESFMCNLMGRQPSEELVSRVCRRYLAIGGSSPLPEIAGSIAVKLYGELAKSGAAYPVEVGMRYSSPFIEDAIGRLHEVGCDRVVMVSLSPFESKAASEACRNAVTEAAEKLGMEVLEAPLVSEFTDYVDYLTSAAASAIEDIQPNEGAVVAFTAHSLPLSDLVDDDPYVAGLKQAAQRIAEALGMEPGHENAGERMFDSFRAFGSDEKPRGWYLVYQSKGERPGGWLGPDLDEFIDACAESAAKAVVVCPIGFLTDHMETLYDLDIVAADRALSADLEFMRAPVPNDYEPLIEAIAQSIVAAGW